MPGRARPACLVAAALAVLVLAVFWRTGSHGFINYDDPVYVYQNPHVRGGLTADGLSWAFATSTVVVGNWHPLTMVSHMADVSFFGLDAGWHHRVGVLLHAGNTVVLFLVLAGMTGAPWRSAFVAALFAVHPLHVESVAWVAERKDLLSTLFLLLAIGAYARYAARGGVRRYLLVVLLFVLGLLSKPMVVTLPFLLLLLDRWPLGRAAWPGTAPSPAALSWGRLVLEKVPLFALSAASCVVTYLVQRGSGAVSPLDAIPFGARLANALASYGAYLGKAAWPSGLAVFYPHPWTVFGSVPAWKVAASLVALAAATAAAFLQAKRRPYLAVGWLWYLGTLVPVIGLVQVGSQAMADRYTYVPLIGIFVAVAWGVPSVLPGPRFRKLVLGALAGASLAALATAARVQAGYWRDGVTLFSRAAAVTDGNWLALNNLANCQVALGRCEEAIGHLREALRIRPDYADAWNNLGVACGTLGRYGEAVGHFREALRIRPTYARAWYNLGVARNRLGRYEEAVGDFREAVRIRSDYAEAWNYLGVSYGRLGQDREAVDCFREALRIRPDYAEARNNLAAAFRQPARPTP